MTLQELTPAVMSHLPTALGVLLTLVAGLVGGVVARRGAAWLVRRLRLDVLAERAGSARLLYALGIRRNVPELVGLVVQVGVLVLMASVLAELLGLPGIAEGLGQVLTYLPRVFAAVMIVLGGVLLADTLRAIVASIASRRADLESPDFVGSIVYYAVVVVSLSMAAGHLGIDTELVNGLILVGFGAAALSAGLMVALAGRNTAHNVISRHYASRMFRKGDLIEVDGHMGELVAFGPQSAWLRTPEGVVVVPCARLTEGIVLTHPEEEEA